MERLGDYLRSVIFGRRGCDPRLVARYRWTAAFGFAVGLEIPLLPAGLEAGAEATGPLAVFSLVGVLGGVVVGRWLVPAEGLQPGR